MKDPALAVRCARLKLILTDVDGVLTDGSLVFLPDGREMKSFHVRDGFGFVLAHRAGLRTGLVSGRSSPLVDQRATELGISFVLQGVIDKKTAVARLLAELGLEFAEIAYIGDDVPDLPVMNAAALSAAPADAPMEVRTQAFMITKAGGGRGCFREFVEAILRARGDWERVVQEFAGVS
jgi:3-deoxy-D-manno-octulosonate 8-phosphate phosphatase (KDO 8-P phosphatase)